MSDSKNASTTTLDIINAAKIFQPLRRSPPNCVTKPMIMSSLSYKFQRKYNVVNTMQNFRKTKNSSPIFLTLVLPPWMQLSESDCEKEINRNLTFKGE